jgi:hypothetical protein
MNLIIIIYILILSIYLICGYNCCSNLFNNEPIAFISFKDDNTYFIKRCIQLSLITLLISIICFITLDINIYILALLLNIVVVIFYYITFNPITDKLTYFFHILWAIPIFILPLFCKFNGVINYNYILITIILLILYKKFLCNYVYF